MKMGLNSNSIANKDSQYGSTVLDVESSAISSSRLDCSGRTRIRRSTFRKAHGDRQDGDDQKPAAKILPVPSKRTRNGVTVPNHPCQKTEQDECDIALAGTCAVALASLDRRACARVQIRDANSTMEQLLLPISFPWSQSKNMLYKPFPRDIDEMSVIMNGDEDHSRMELNSETFRTMNAAKIPKVVPICTLRTDDPGVVELRTYVKPTASHSRSLQRTYSTTLHDAERQDSSIHGELSLQMYCEVQRKKRRREDFEAATTNKKLISFRVGSTSSRSTTFSPSEHSRNPLFLLATYPKHIHDGVKRYGLEAYKEGFDLGSYNGRQLPLKSSVIADSTSKNRFIVGRTRLVWSEKERSESKSLRSPYCSILTRQRLDSNVLKRPVSVKVGIRINGVLLSHATEPVLGCLLAVSEPSYSHSIKTVTSALDAACLVDKELSILDTSCQADEEYSAVVSNETSSTPEDYSQCNLNLPNFLAEIAQNTKPYMQQQFINEIDRIRAPISIYRQLTVYRSVLNGAKAHNFIYRIDGRDEIDGSYSNLCSEDTEIFRNGRKFLYQTKLRLKLDIVPPCFDCLPTEDGLIQVSCTMPGKITLNTDEILDSAEMRETPPSLLLTVLSIEIDRCPNCWNYMHYDPICSACNNPNGSFLSNDNSKWIHSIGSSCSNLDSFTPANMFTSTSTEQQQRSDTYSGKWYNDKSFCHLCNRGTSGSITVSSCSAEGCNVRFHPICAMIASASNEVQYRNRCHKSNGSYEKLMNGFNYEEDDTYLCTQYTQSLMKATFVKAPKIHQNTSRSNKRAKEAGTTENSTAFPKATTNTKKAAVIALPILFCPYHNPKRCHDKYGLYPQCCGFNHDTIRIPPEREALPTAVHDVESE